MGRAEFDHVVAPGPTYLDGELAFNRGEAIPVDTARRIGLLDGPDALSVVEATPTSARPGTFVDAEIQVGDPEAPEPPRGSIAYEVWRAEQENREIEIEGPEPASIRPEAPMSGVSPPTQARPSETNAPEGTTENPTGGTAEGAAGKTESAPAGPARSASKRASGNPGNTP